MSKDEIMIEYLLTCPYIRDNSLFFNYAEGEDNTNHFETNATDVSVQKPFVDGSVLKQYTFTLASYKSLGYRAVDVEDVSTDENIDDLEEVQQILEWINEQADNGNFPNFGTGYVVEEMECSTDRPKLDGMFNDAVGTPIARYSIVIRLQYIDNTKLLWNN